MKLFSEATLGSSIELSVTTEMLFICAVQFSCHQPHGASKHVVSSREELIFKFSLSFLN